MLVFHRTFLKIGGVFTVIRGNFEDSHVITVLVMSSRVGE